MNARCPKCGSSNSKGWNWFYAEIDRTWGHECHDCDNVFITSQRMPESSEPPKAP